MTSTGNKKVLVTGGAGWVGRFVVRELLDCGYHVTIVDKTLPTQLRCHESSSVNCRWICQELSAESDIQELLHQNDCVIHLAGIAEPDPENDAFIYQYNMEITRAILQSCQKSGIRKLVIASSVNAIGADWLEEPLAPDYLPIDENHPTRATDGYSKSKWESEKLCDDLASRCSLQIASLRLHGVWDDDRCQQRAQITRNDPEDYGEKGFWGWVHGRDAARAFRLCLETSWNGHEVIFINSNHTTLDLPTIDALRLIFSLDVAHNQLSGTCSPVSTEKAKRLLGWSPAIHWKDFCNAEIPISH